MFYTNSLPTTASNAADFTRREVQRSTLARRFQASLGFPPDDKFITALNAGTFLNCDILPADVSEAHRVGLVIQACDGCCIKKREAVIDVFGYIC
jgi:hypothetical protein